MQETMPATLPPLPDDAAIRQATNEILRNSDYVLAPQSRDTEAFLFKIWEAVKRVFKGLMQWSRDLYDVSPILYWLLMAVLFLILIALIWHIAYSLRKAFTRSDDETALGRPEESDSDEPALWERRAGEAQARGDSVYGLRCLLMAGLLRLESGQKKRLRRGATNREILRRYRDSAAFEPLKQMVDLVDLKWFGGVPCENADYEACAQAYARLRAVAPAMAAGGGAPKSPGLQGLKTGGGPRA